MPSLTIPTSIPFPSPRFLSRLRGPRRPSAIAPDGLRSLPKFPELETEKKERVEQRPRPRDGVVPVSRELEVLYDDGFGRASVKDFFEAARSLRECSGGGPPRWFCPVECGKPVKGAPLLLFLPGSDGTGLGLILHHKSLGKVFEVRCLHIPPNDRTTFEGLIELVEWTVKQEHSLSPTKPIYLVGDSFGGCLALAVAARNPNMDLVLILANPATSFGRSQLQPSFPLLEALPRNLHDSIPYVLSFVMGEPVKLAMASISDELPPLQALEQISNNLVSLLPLLSELADIIPKETLLWKLKLLKTGAAYVNSRLHAVDAEVILLIGGKDSLLPSAEEADRLFNALRNCRVRYFKDNGHTLLLEDGLNLLTVIKCTEAYRLSRKRDWLRDFIPPTRSEYKKFFDQEQRLYRLATSSVMLSTLSNGRIVRGLSGVPNKGPVILVGYHMLMGLELISLYREFVKEKKVVLHGMAHPGFFSNLLENSRTEISLLDYVSAFGAIPVNPTNMYKLLLNESFVLLYPGGAREALHYKGEEYKLFWPEQPEFVRMAARFGATIVPFGVVGEDDVVELVIDYNDLKNIPTVRESIEEINKNIKLREEFSREPISDQRLYFPGVLPKLPGRFYYLFGKPFETRGKDILRDKKSAALIYQQIQSEIKGMISFLKMKRDEDPYRNITKRALYQASWSWPTEVPTFEL